MVRAYREEKVEMTLKRKKTLITDPQNINKAPKQREGLKKQNEHKKTVNHHYVAYKKKRIKNNPGGKKQLSQQNQLASPKYFQTEIGHSAGSFPKPAENGRHSTHNTY